MVYKFDSTVPVKLKENYFKMGEKNPEGIEIYTNNLFWIKDKKPFYGLMGEIHITRTRRADWEDRIVKMKAAGLEIISSYLFWIHHEFQEGEFNFSGDYDIKYFLSLCKKHGMYVSLRIGPWITAECKNGGLPNWVYNGDFSIRENDTQYLKYTKKWYEAIYYQVNEYLYRNGGNIICIQIDNENYNRAHHMLALKQLALEVGFTAPLYTVTAWGPSGGAIVPEKEFLAMFGGYPDAAWAKQINTRVPSGHYKFTRNRNSADICDQALLNEETRETNIDYNLHPNAWCELGTGLIVSKHRRPLITPMDNYAMTLTKLGGGMNVIGYYLFTGGKNKIINDCTLNWGYENPTENCYPMVNYDFQAPIGTYGNITDSYRLLKLINLFIKSYGSELCKMQTVFQKDSPRREDLVPLRYAMRKKDNSGYIFVNNYIRCYEKETINDVQFELPDGRLIPEHCITVKNNTSFFFPFNIKYGNEIAEYITAQPVTRYQNTFFFKAIDGVKPLYKFEGKAIVEAKIGRNSGFVMGSYMFVTLSEEDAMHILQTDKGLYIGEDCDLIDENGDVSSCGFGSYTYYTFKDSAFERHNVKRDYDRAEVSYYEVTDVEINDKFMYELVTDCGAGDKCERVDRRLKYYKLEVFGNDGYIRIKYSGDSAQVYLNGNLYDDNFYNGSDWVLPAKELENQEVIIVIAEYQHNLYVDVEPRTTCNIESIAITSY